MPTGNANAAEKWDITVIPPAGSPLHPRSSPSPSAGDDHDALDFALTDTPPPPPVAPNYTESTSAGVTLMVPAGGGVLSKDSGTGILITHYQAESAASGQVSLATDGSYTYTPRPGFTGSDTFTYVITDEFGTNAFGTVTIDVEAPTPPTAPNYTESTPFDTELTVAAAQGLLSRPPEQASL